MQISYTLISASSDRENVMDVEAMPALADATSSRVSDFISDEVGEYANRLTGRTLRIEQFSAGRFSGRLTSLRLDHVQIIRERTCQSLMKPGMAWPGVMIFSLPVAASGDSHFNGHVLSFPSPLFVDGADVPPLLTPRYLDVVHLVVDRQWLAGYFKGIGECRLADDLFAVRHLGFNVSAERNAAMRRVITDLFDACGRTHVFDFPASRNELQSSLLRFIAEALTSGRSTSMNSVTSQKKVADHALDFALSRRDTPPGVDDLCRHVGVSRRNLQDCFQNSFGTSPSRFLRVVRLNAVRRELKMLAAAKRRVSIGDVAASWGFWHWSRFADSYRELFGELPSQTLQVIRSSRHSTSTTGFDRLDKSYQEGPVFGRNEALDATRHAWLAADQARWLEG
ncbi:helix-turn-helix domain-containing protein [Bradyrhizobium sp. SSUT18]|uniref:helix-turn-helix domain-containing protein n=1 Tax=Bradyrhizobium sp. SSUT18 TaxID=3040602 RepID=UPI0024477A5A|nr:helix-turn-helix domain-containing protein [Bradyrhizobium sp. SSUT18]MDH2401842.1 helix-turn-helix domain-containing protein [Bradyrhizobium sp. SSUT18]